MGDAEALEDPHEVLPTEGRIHGVIVDRAGVLIDDGGDFETGAVFEVAGLDTDRPRVMRLRRCNGRLNGGGAAAFPPAPDRHPQALLTP